MDVKFCVSDVATEICFPLQEREEPTSQSNVKCHVIPLDKKRFEEKSFKSKFLHSQFRFKFKYKNREDVLDL